MLLSEETDSSSIETSDTFSEYSDSTDSTDSTYSADRSRYRRASPGDNMTVGFGVLGMSNTNTRDRMRAVFPDGPGETTNEQSTAMADTSSYRIAIEESLAMSQVRSFKALDESEWGRMVEIVPSVGLDEICPLCLREITCSQVTKLRACGHCFCRPDDCEIAGGLRKYFGFGNLRCPSCRKHALDLAPPTASISQQVHRPPPVNVADRHGGSRVPLRLSR